MGNARRSAHLSRAATRSASARSTPTQVARVVRARSCGRRSTCVVVVAPGPRRGRGPRRAPTGRRQNDALPVDGVDVILGGHLHIVTQPAEGSAARRRRHGKPRRPHGARATRARSRSTSAGSISSCTSASDNGDPEKRSRISPFALQQSSRSTTRSPTIRTSRTCWAVLGQAEPAARPRPIYGVFACTSTAGTARRSCATTRRRRLPARQPRRALDAASSRASRPTSR